MIDKDLATERQQRDFGSVWTEGHNFLSRISYVRASPLRILTYELREHFRLQQPGLKVLEYGFGHGKALFRFGPSVELYGVELSETAIRVAEQTAHRKGYQRFEFKRICEDDPVRVDFPSDHFDIVLCSHTVEHVYSDEALLRELFRVLRPGGQCFLLVPLDVDAQAVLAEDKERQNPKFPDATYHVWQYNLPTFRWLCEKAGFEIVRSEQLDSILDRRLTWNRALQVSASVVFSVLPYKAWRLLDRRSQRQGFHPRQCLVIATKGRAVSE